MDRTAWTKQWPYAVCGVLAAAAGMAVGHFVAGFVNPAASPVLAVGSTVIDATPTPVKEWAVKQFGTADKPILLASVSIVTVLAAAGIGLLWRRRPTLSTVLIVLLAGLAGAAAMLRPAALPQDVLPGIATAAVGAVVLTALGRLASSGTMAATATPATAATTAATHESPLDHSAYAPGAAGRPGRRNFLLGAAGVTAGAATLGAVGQRLSAPSTAASSITLPAPQQPLPALVAGIEGQVKGISAFRTPVDRFYRIDTALVIPRVDVDSWRLEVDGDVEQPFTLTFEELLKLPMIERDITLNCVSNEVGGPYIGSTRWLGVRVKDLLDRARVKQGVEQILSESTDGMTISTPLEALTDDRDAMVAIAMDGKPLTAKHGFPARLITPGLYGYVGATKWLTKLTATTYAAEKAYWTKRGWAEKAEVKTQARIDTPAGLATYPPGKVAIGGVAWAQQRGIKEVEVRVDDGPWQKATLGPDANIDYWRQWYWIWDAKPGRHDLTVRATDATGQPQTDKRAEPFPDGAAGYHSIVVIID